MNPESWKQRKGSLQLHNNVVMTKNEAIIDSIKSLLDAYHALSAQSNKNETDLNALRYLIGQSIRQYDIPLENHHVSQAALVRWKCLSKDKIEKYHYRDQVKCDNLSKPTRFKLFKGASKNGTYRRLVPNNYFIFRDMFHEDHVIPVSLILNAMVSLNPISRTSIEELLNSMHLCVLLKDEDRHIGKTSGRTLNFKDIIKNVYNANGITLAP